MKWFDNWICKKYKDILNRTGLELQEKEIPIPRLSTRSIDSNGINFTVYRANGGYILEHRVYDTKNDRTDNSLYIITEDKNLGEEIGKIIVFEALRRV